MHSIKFIRANPEMFDNALKSRGYQPLSANLISEDENVRNIQTKAQKIQSERNHIAKEIGLLKQKGKDVSTLLEDVAKSKLQEIEFQKEADNALKSLNYKLSIIPNIPRMEVPIGKDEKDNKEIRKHLEPSNFTFTPKEHWELGENLELMDFETASELSGSRFVVLKGLLARLERALGQFMLDVHTIEHGYKEYSVPSLIDEKTAFATGNLPKFEEDLFKTTDGRYLIPTAEIPLTASVANKILNSQDLPIRLTALTACFRSEAGSAGRDTRGMLRQHQFYKVELVSITNKEDAINEHERMLQCSENILKKLNLPYRTMLLCTGDMGFSSEKTYDIEVWLPGQNAYREISSCSVCGDFQARRMNAKYKTQNGTELVNTLNGSGVAVGRALIAVMENYQQEDGSIIIPDVLVPYMNGIKKITKGV